MFVFIERTSLLNEILDARQLFVTRLRRRLEAIRDLAPGWFCSVFEGGALRGGFKSGTLGGLRGGCEKVVRGIDHHAGVTLDGGPGFLLFFFVNVLLGVEFELFFVCVGVCVCI